MRILWLVAFLVLWLSPHPAQAQGRSDAALRVRVITNDFVLPGKIERLKGLAERNGVVLDGVYVESPGEPSSWLADIDLVILDTPRPMDAAKVSARLGNALGQSAAPWIRVGGGPPAFERLPPATARQLIGYYAAGGEANLAAMFAYIKIWRSGDSSAAVAPPVALPSTGFYHPAAQTLFATPEAYLEWGRSRWRAEAPRVAIAIHSGLITNMQTQTVDALIARSEARGVLPIVFWFDATDPKALQKVLNPAKAEALVIATHLQNGPARQAEFLELGIPVMQAIAYRDGDPKAWADSTSGMPSHLVAPFLAVPEGWGVSDPMVIEAVQRGEPAPIQEQIDALVGKAARLSALRSKPASEKKLAVMFWNYPPGEKNFSASNLNVPRSLERLTGALAEAGYDVSPTGEQQLIEAGQAMLGGLYRPETLDALLANDLAATLPLPVYQRWLEALPASRREQIVSRWGKPEEHWALRSVGDTPQFVIPRLRLGKLIVLPQPPRSGRPGQDYHDTNQPAGHSYLATYVYLQNQFAADALIHFGTHGTQEWTPGKDRGLSVKDFPFLAVAELPVFYPYIQDNVAEALQAKRRGRAVSISHQTPPFAPAGLYDELRDLHAMIHEYSQLEEGAVRERTAAVLRRVVAASNLHADMGWDDAAIERDFPGFLAALHDHVHELADHVMPLGLHSFGEPAAAEHRLSTVMQQLGKPFYARLGPEPDEFFAVDARTLQDSAPYRFLHRYLREGHPAGEIADAQLRGMVERGMQLDRHLAETGEIEALLAGLSGRFIPAGPGGDPIRNPDVPSGRNLYGFEPDKLPTKLAFEAGEKALQQLLDAYRKDHDGRVPQKLAFSLWSSETIRHLGLLESQVLHALGLRPVWNEGGRVVALEIVPAAEMTRPRIDVVLQITSVYRDQFDGFMRLLADAIERIADLNDGNAVARHSGLLASKLEQRGLPHERARRLAALRLFSNEPGDYGSGLPDEVLRSTTWESEAHLAEHFLARLQYAYGRDDWGLRIEEGNLFAEQLRGVEAAVLSRSSRLHGILSTDHPFEYLGGLSLAVRHLDGNSPSLYIADLRDTASRIATTGQFLAAEMRSRYLNPHWISGMQKEGYAGTLEMVNFVNNLWGWQVTDTATVRPDQWQAVHDTFVRDVRRLGLAQWFADHNPTAQAQIAERMIEAIRKDYWDASTETRRELVELWQRLTQERGLTPGETATREFIAEMAAGFGLKTASDGPQYPSAAQRVSGPLLQPVAAPPPAEGAPWQAAAGILLLICCSAAGAVIRIRANRLSA